ncbi:MAG: hypothetical protein KDB53_15320, partial [Planctomycetes bacterium]|nr:hypothetical protein [Planctomycetota bacterium]
MKTPIQWLTHARWFRHGMGALVLCCAVLGFPGSPQADAGEGEVSNPLPMAGLMTAYATHEAGKFQAQADYWYQVARGLNEAPIHVTECLDQAHLDYMQRLQLNADQYQARYDALALLGSQAYNPVIEPEFFSAEVTNPYFPLVVGETRVYEKQTLEGLEHHESTVLDKTVWIQGVECRAVRKIEMHAGVVFEETVDWYAQHQNGDVWYFGELSMHYEDGFVTDIDGSWRAGKNGAKAGIVVKAQPVSGMAFRHEYAPGIAEDISIILAVDVVAESSLGTFHDCVEVEETTPMEPMEIERKI